MLSSTEQIVFIIMVVIFGGWTVWGFYGAYKIMRASRSAPKRKNVLWTLTKALLDVGLQKTIITARPLMTMFHTFIFVGFSYYFIINVTDLLEGFVPGFELIYGGEPLVHAYPETAAIVETGVFNIYNVLGDVLSVFVLIGMIAFIIRRASGKDKRQRFNDGVLLNPKVLKGSVHKDSYIVGGFIMSHVGARFLGQALRLARDGEPDPYMPFASMAANLFSDLSPEGFEFGIHATWWIAIGLVVAFLPYFIISKHVHIMVTPINIGLGKQNPRGQLDPAVPKGSTPMVNPGARTLQEFSWPRILDAYACIMCNRCNDVCPAHNSGWSLAPAAIEVNKRYLLNKEFTSLIKGNISTTDFTTDVISPEAIWACTTCYACVDICPVGNEPMADIVDLRRRMIMDGDKIDSGIQGALESVAKSGNWFNQGARKRARWAKKLEFDIKIVTEEEAEYLWFVGDTASYDERVTPRTQMVARIFNSAGFDYGILGKDEHNSGNDVRRAGEEGLFEQSVEKNLEAFGKSNFKKIVTTDPHSLNTLRNEYPQYGGQWEVDHYAKVFLELFEQGKLEVKVPLSHYSATYHDPCYLGRYNGGYAAPRELLEKLGVRLTEMPRNKANSFCCGAGGFQIAVNSTPEGERPAENRINEALSVVSPNGHKAQFVVACPKDIVMYTDAVKTTGNEDNIEVKDLIDLIAEAIGMEAPAEADAEMEEVVV